MDLTGAEFQADALQDGQAAAAAASLAARRHLLLELHRRVGRCSLLQLLPLALVKEVLDLAAPLQPCRLGVRAPEGG